MSKSVTPWKTQDLDLRSIVCLSALYIGKLSGDAEMRSSKNVSTQPELISAVSKLRTKGMLHV